MKYIPDMQDEVKEWVTTLLPVRDPTKTCIKLVTEAAELLDAVSSGGPNMADKASEEVADVLILLVDVADQLGIDIDKEFARKMEINRQRKWVKVNGSLTHAS